MGDANDFTRLSDVLFQGKPGAVKHDDGITVGNAVNRGLEVSAMIQHEIYGNRACEPGSSEHFTHKVYPRIRYCGGTGVEDNRFSGKGTGIHDAM